MNSYVCEKGHIFIFPAKIVKVILPQLESGQMTSFVPELEPKIEIHACPYCQSLDLSEVIEPQEDITSVKSVPLEDVDAWLKEGYKVRELYAKTATLVKLEAQA